MSHALLLRLFLSPSFFSVHVALQYLMRYSDNIGITYYLTRRLTELDTNELREVWGFVCHLLVTRPSTSRSLECFVISMSEKSTHLAMFTLWFMQAYLRDFSTSRSGSNSVAICQRVVHQCHEIIFGDSITHTNGPYVSLKVPTKARFSRTKLNHHAEPSFVGMGCIIGASIAMPAMAEVVGNVAVEQGRLEEDSRYMTGKHENGDDGTPRSLTSTGIAETPTEQTSDDNGTTDVPKSMTDVRRENIITSTPSRRNTASAARTSPALPLRPGMPRNSYDPFDQLDASRINIVSLPSQSSPSLPTLKRTKTTSGASVDIFLQRYTLDAQIFFLQGHYCRTELRFISALEQISNRVLVVPKPARLSALRAELTSLNHKLPAEVCMPMWCTSADAQGPRGIPKAHHRIVRIPPGESVVLNSAERAPYMIIIEILNNDLDFDPGKRGNKEVLKRLLTSKHGPSSLKRSFSSTARDAKYMDYEQTDSLSKANIFDDDMTEDVLDLDPDAIASTSLAATEHSEDSDHEVDLVEQIYGADLSVRQMPDLSESLVLPAMVKNKDLDAVTWSRITSPPPTPLTHVQSPQLATPSDSISPKMDAGDVETRPPVLSLDEYSDRMRTAAVMLAQLHTSVLKDSYTPNSPKITSKPSNTNSWLPGSRWINGTQPDDNAGNISTSNAPNHVASNSGHLKLQPSEAASIKERIMQEMLALEKERMERMQENNESDIATVMMPSSKLKTAEDEAIIRRELNQVDPSAVVFQESWAAKKSRIKQGSPYGHLATWDCVSVIVKTGADLRQEQLAVQLIREFQRIWTDEKCPCWVRPFQILITSGSSGLVETITDAVSIHSIKKAEYARRLARGGLGHVTLMDHFINSYGDPSSAKFARSQLNFAKSLAGYCIVTYLLQIKDRHNGNILLHRDGHLIHIDFGFMLSNSPGNLGFEAAPFKLPSEYIEVMGGVDSPCFVEFKRLFHVGFDAARKHSDRILTIVELMQKDSRLPCFTALGEQTAQQLRDRFQLKLPRAAVSEYYDRLIMTSLGSHWTRLYDSYQYYAQSIL